MTFNLKKTSRLILQVSFLLVVVFSCNIGAMSGDMAIDPDGLVLSAINSMCNDNTKLQSMAVADLTALLGLLDTVDSFFGDPAYPGWDSSKKNALKNNVQLVLNSKVTTPTTPTSTTPATPVTSPTTPVTTPTTPTTPVTTPTTPTPTIDTQVVAAVTAALSKAKALDKVNALIAVITKFGTKAVTAATSNTFAGAIMTVGGNLITSSSVLAPVNSYSTKKTYTAADKKAIKPLIASIKSGLGDIAKFSLLLKNVATSKLLTATQKNYVKGSLSPLMVKIDKLSKVK